MLKSFSQILHKAGSLAVDMQKPNLERFSKGGSDFATEADLRVQDLLVQELMQAFPGIPVLGEEDSEHRINLGESFIIDPIDGTFDYSYGGEEWGVMISYFKDAEVKYVGVIQPRQNNLFLGGSQEGSLLNGVQVERKTIPDSIEESILIQCLGNWLSKSYYQEILLPTISRARILRGYSSAVQVLMQLAKGNAHCFIGEGGKVWDYAPISLLTKTLSGLESDFRGAELKWIPDVMQVVFSLNKELHQNILNCLDVTRLS